MPGTSQQLKGDIDAGKTGDKIPMFDPGLSPLGTDDEAAGTPNTPEQVAMARKLERRDAPTPPLEQAQLANGSSRPYVRAFIWVIAGVVLLLALALVAAIAWRARA